MLKILYMFPGFGTLVNTLLVILGSSMGIKGSRYIPENLKSGIMHAIALFTIMLGVRLMYENKPETLKVFFILLVGSLVGHLLDIEEKIHTIAKGGSFLRGFITASLLFTVGPITLLGCILEGTKGDSSLILSKAMMDGFSSLILSSSLGKGVLFSSLFVLFFQGTVTAFAFYFGDFLDRSSMSNTLFVGGGLMVLTGLKIYGLLEKVKVLNLLPSLLIGLFL